jgi:hypothetical protein
MREIDTRYILLIGYSTMHANNHAQEIWVMVAVASTIRLDVARLVWVPVRLMVVRGVKVTTTTVVATGVV